MDLFEKRDRYRNNKTTIPWVGITPARLLDGNGIIVDVNKTPYERCMC